MFFLLSGSNFQLCNFQENFNFMEDDSDEDPEMDVRLFLVINLTIFNSFINFC